MCSERVNACNGENLVKRQTRLGQDRTGVDPFDVTVCQSGLLLNTQPR